MAAEGMMNSIRDALVEIFGRLRGRGENAMAQRNLLDQLLDTGHRELIRLAQAAPDHPSTNAVLEIIENSGLPPTRNRLHAKQSR